MTRQRKRGRDEGEIRRKDGKEGGKEIGLETDGGEEKKVRRKVKN